MPKSDVRLATGSDAEWVVILEIKSDRCRIREVGSGESRWVARSTLFSLDTPSLHEIGQVGSDSVGASASAIRTARGWGLVLVVGAASPVTVRALLDTTSECESDLNGLLAELEAGGVLDRTEIAGERAYELSETGASAVESVWSASK